MKQQILDALKAKFEGVSDKILSRIADNLAKTVTNADDVETAVAGVTFQQVLESYGDSRATEASSTAVKNYETKHGLKDGKAIEQPKPAEPKAPTTGGEQIPEWAKALIESNKQMSAQLHQFEVERTTNSRKQQLAQVVGKLPESIRKAYERTPIESMTEDDFTALLNDVNGEVEAIGHDLKPQGASGRPFTGSTPVGDRLTKAQEEAIAQREGAPKPDGQPF